MALKGPQLEEELAQAQNAIKELGGRVDKVIAYSLPDSSQRTLVAVKKYRRLWQNTPVPVQKWQKNRYNPIPFCRKKAAKGVFCCWKILVIYVNIW